MEQISTGSFRIKKHRCCEDKSVPYKNASKDRGGTSAWVFKLLLILSSSKGHMVDQWSPDLGTYLIGQSEKIIKYHNYSNSPVGF